MDNMPSDTPPNLAEILADVPLFKAQYLALKGALTYAKGQLTRKMNSELKLAQTSKPCVDSTGSTHTGAGVPNTCCFRRRHK